MTDITSEGGSLISSTPATITGFSMVATQTDDQAENIVECWLFDLAQVPESFGSLEPVFGCLVATELTAPAEGSVTVPLGDMPESMITFTNGVVALLEKSGNTATATITTS
jgi:hypothetical protein